jgi:hypothetical protein
LVTFSRAGHIDLYYAHSTEIAGILNTHTNLAEQGLDVIDTLTPNLQALLDGQGSTAIVTNEQIQQAQAFLDALLPHASPELQQAIANERITHSLEELAGMTMDQAQAHILGAAGTSTPTQTPTSTPPRGIFAPGAKWRRRNAGTGMSSTNCRARKSRWTSIV